jgi:hypothetical protein
MDSATVIGYVVMTGIVGWTLISAIIHIQKGECKIRNKYGGGVDRVQRSEDPVRFWLWVGVKLFIAAGLMGSMVYMWTLQ